MSAQIFTVPSVIIVDILSSLPLEVYLILVLLLVLLIGSILVPAWLGKRHSPAADIQSLSTLSCQPRVVMNAEEALVYNMLHLVVRDRFMLLAKVPVRNLIQTSEKNVSARRALAFVTRNVLADFVFLHPGTLIPEKVIFVGPRDSAEHTSNLPHASVLALLTQAQIGIVQLSAQRAYTVEELTEILGLKEEE